MVNSYTQLDMTWAVLSPNDIALMHNDLNVMVLNKAFPRLTRQNVLSLTLQQFNTYGRAYTSPSKLLIRVEALMHCGITHLPLEKWPPSLRRHFQTHFSE